MWSYRSVVTVGWLLSACLLAGGRLVCAADAVPEPAQVVEVVGMRHGDWYVRLDGQEPAPAASVWGALETLPFVSLSVRGAGGVQHDASALAGTFEQTAVCIEGIDIGDVQTGHHDLDIGLLAAETSHVELASIGRGYAGSGLAGTLNVGLRVPHGYGLELAGGEHGLFRASGYAGVASRLGGAKILTGGGFEYARSAGWRPGTDFRALVAAFSGLSEAPEGTAYYRLGISSREFGAQDFYAPYPSFEKTNSQMLLLKYALAAEAPGVRDAYLLLKRHGDLFILDRQQPDLYQGEHVSMLATAGSNLEIGSTTLTLEARGEWLESSTLGQRSRQTGHLGVALPRQSQHWSISGGLDVTDGGVHGALSGRAAAPLDAEGRRQLSLVLASTYRLPSMTELYYWDPRNQGDPALAAETAEQAVLSLQLGQAAVYAFRRCTDDVIDWIRYTAAEPWQATNTGAQAATGVGCSVNVGNAARTYFEYMDADTPPVTYESKYALRYVQWKAGVSGAARLASGFGLEYRLEGRRRRGWESGVLLADLAVAWRRKSLKLTVGGTNLLDEQYEDVPGAVAPGRWLYGSLSVRW